ncbi:hypothetical protein JHK85_004156 [Glycine max]|nr:hypothetical protein JHK85_004156 [Glycine max]
MGRLILLGRCRSAVGNATFTFLGGHLEFAGMEDLAEMLEKQLASELSKMTLEEALPLARAFSHHLTLMGIAETHHSPEDRDMWIEDLVGEKTSIWQTDELRRSKPTPVDEARAAGMEDLAEMLEKQLASELSKMTLEEALPLARAFSHHLTLMGGRENFNMATDELRRSKPTPVDEARAEGNDEEDHHEHWNGSMSRSQSKHPNQQASPLPTKLPAGAHIPLVLGLE